MARTDPQVNIRMPDSLKSALTDVAEKNGRSLNAEIVRRLELSLAASLQQDDARIENDGKVVYFELKTVPAEVREILEYLDRAKERLAATYLAETEVEKQEPVVEVRRKAKNKKTS